MTGAPRILEARDASDHTIAQVVTHLRRNGLIAYPTETVYGLGGSLSEAAVERVRACKARDRNKPLIALVPSPEAVSELRWTDPARELARIFWPGALTLVLEDPLGIFPRGVRDEDTHAVGVRVSPHALVARLLEGHRGPLTSTSLNAPGEAPAESGADAAEVVTRLGVPEALVLDAGKLTPSLPSTVVDCTGSEPVVLREGAVPIGRLRCAIPSLEARRVHG